LVLNRAQKRLEHHVEISRLGPLATGAAVWAGDLLKTGRFAAFPGLEVLFQMIRAEAPVTRQTFSQRVVECIDMPGGHPHAAGQDHRGIKANDVFPLGHHRAPPLFLDVLLELNAERAVVPGRAGPAVDLPSGEDEATAFTQTDDVVESTGRRHELLLQTLSCAIPGWDGIQRTRLSPLSVGAPAAERTRDAPSVSRGQGVRLSVSASFAGPVAA